MLLSWLRDTPVFRAVRWVCETASRNAVEHSLRARRSGGLTYENIWSFSSRGRLARDIYKLMVMEKKQHYAGYEK